MVSMDNFEKLKVLTGEKEGAADFLDDAQQFVLSYTPEQPDDSCAGKNSNNIAVVPTGWKQKGSKP